MSDNLSSASKPKTDNELKGFEVRASSDASAATKPSAQEYLKRIGYNGPLDVSLKTLTAVHEAHVYAVPYENLDIMDGKYLSLDIHDVYEKIVVKRRGGYCFELNGLFAWLLRELSFDVTEYYGRYLLDEPFEVPMRRHRISRVNLDGKSYVCDVGVGVSAPKWPLLMVEGLVQNLDGELYRLVKHPILGWVVEGIYKGKWDRLYSFTEDPQLLIDFEMPNHWCLTHPDSIFKNNTMVYIRTREGRNTIADIIDSDGSKVMQFRKFTSKGVETSIPRTEEEYRQALLSHFGITLY